jgi:uncharacterized protein YbjQ (UPF0145 family)
MTREQTDRLFGRPATTDATTGPTAGALTPQPLSAQPRPAAAVTHRGGTGGTAGATSDLSIDETLLLHSIGWEPLDMVIGASVASFPAGIFNWTNAGFLGPDSASQAFTAAMSAAATRMRTDCHRAGGTGVIGVEVELSLHPHVVHVTLVGTAVRPAGARPSGNAFTSDLSTRDFCLLHVAGWEPLGIAFGTAFSQAPYRSAGQALRQMNQNVELTNLTNALYEARELGMGRMQESALAMGAAGVVAVHLIDRPLPFAKHIIGFTTWGTAVRLTGEAHVPIHPRVVVSLDDAVDLFDLRGAMGEG